MDFITRKKITHIKGGTTLEKVKLTKQQGEAVEILMGRGEKEKIYVIREHAGLRKWFFEYQAFNNMDTDTLIRALYIGYEIKKTEQEIMQEIWDSPLSNKSLHFYRRGISVALSMVGRKDLIPQDKS